MMIRDLFVPLSELLFWFTGGVPLINTPWFLAWAVAGAVIMAAPMWFAIGLAHRRSPLKWLPGAAFVVAFFPMLLVITSPGIIQPQMLEECLPAQTVTVDTDLAKGIKLSVRHCRSKENFYDENFGEWQAWAVDRRQ